MTNRAVVVGGGIGGLAVAGGLSRAGWQVTVIERAEEFRPVGAGITVAPNGVRALDWLGLGERLRERAKPFGAAGLRTDTGRWLLRTNIEVVQERFGVPAFALHRADLHGMLLDAAAGAQLRTGHRVTGIDQNDDGATVTVETAERRQRIDADVVIGADGLHSTIRRILFPSHPGPSYAGYVAWRGVVDADAVPRADVPISATESWGRGQRFGIVPLADGRVYWFATVIGPAGTGRADDLAAVAARFTGWHDPIAALLAATQPDALLWYDIADLRHPLESYVKGRVVLLGDAAHAITPDLGQGGNLALEDAVTLTAVLTRVSKSHDIPHALRGYDAARRHRTQRLVRVSAQTARFVQPRGQLGATVRNLLVGLIPTSIMLRASEEALAWTPEPASPVAPKP